MGLVVENQATLHRWLVWLIATKLANHLGARKYVIAGSYRRGKWWCNDVDLLIEVTSESEIEGIKFLMKKLGWKFRRIPNEDIFALQYYKMSRGGKMIVLDLFLATPDIWGNALLFTTGSKDFNDRIRADIISTGYTWSNPRYFTHIKSNKQLSFASEKAAFNFLNLRWIRPSLR